MRVAILALVTLLVQRLLGSPGLPTLWTAVELPMVWIVWPTMCRHDRRWIPYAVLLGLMWDVVMNQPVIGPAGIAWSATAVVLHSLASMIADRSPLAWAIFGCVGAMLVTLILQVCLLPLGLATLPTWTHLGQIGLATGAWCGLVGWTLTLDLPTRWANHRARRLR
jgi:hypothetical protein